MKGEARARNISQQHNEIDREGNVEGVGSGNRNESEGHFRERIYLGTNWKIDQEEALKVTFRFIVWMVWVHYNVDNKPLKEKYERSSGFHGENNELHFK